MASNFEILQTRQFTLQQEETLITETQDFLEHLTDWSTAVSLLDFNEQCRP